MNKLFTFALAAAFSCNAVQAQILKYGAEAGEAAPDTVNWYGNWVEAGGEIHFDANDAATGSGAINIWTPEDAGGAQDWERVLKFDGLQIKPNTNYRVRLAAKCPGNAVVGLAMMCGDENCDMPFVLPTENGYYSQKRELSGFDESEYQTKAALFHYTTDDYQKQIYPNVKADDPNPLGANRFLRVTIKSVGEYYLDDIVVEEAPIAGCYFGEEAIKVDFGFKTNIADLAQAAGGTLSLEPSCVTVKINGEEAEVYAVELKSDGFLYIFPENSLDQGDKIAVSFNAAESGIKYVGAETPGDGVDVPSFEAENGYYDWTIEASSVIYEEPKVLSANPENGSFEMDEDIKEFSFTFDKEIMLSGDAAPIAVLSGNGIKATLKLKETAETGKVATFVYDGAPLTKGKYNVTVSGVQSSVGVDALADTKIAFETGKVAVAEIEYTDVETIAVKGTNGNHSENWTSYFNDEEVVPAGGGIRMFEFPADGKYTTGFYLSQRDADERGTALSYGEKESDPFTLPEGNVQVNILASAWQGNTGNFNYELTDEAGNVVKSGSAAAEIHIPDQGTAANEVSKISINIEGCKAGKYVLRLSTKSGGYGNAIIVWGLDVKTYQIGQGETADNKILVNGSMFAEVPGDGVPAAGTGWSVYQNGELLEKGSVAGQRTRFLATTIKNIGNAFYNRDMGGQETLNYMTYGEDPLDTGEEPQLILEEDSYNFSWYLCNWKGDEQTYTFQILDAENDNAVVYERKDKCTVNCNGVREYNAKEAMKIEFDWTPDHYGQYILKWYMTGEGMVGSIKVQQMGSLAVFWHTQLNDAIAAAQEERDLCDEEQYAGATRDALDKAISEAKTVTYHTGKEYTAAMDRLAQYVKDMAARRDALSRYDAALSNLMSKVDAMADSKYAQLESYKTANALVDKYFGVEGYTIETEELLPIVNQMETLNTLNTNLMAENTGVASLTDQLVKLANVIVKFSTEDEPTENEYVLAAGNAVSDDQALAEILKLQATSALYKAIAAGYDFMELEFPDEEESEDNQKVPSTVDLSGFIRNSVFYTTLDKDHAQPVNQAASDGTCPGWELIAPNGYAADWGWGGWSGNNVPVEPANITNSHIGTKWATDLETYQTYKNVPVGTYTLGASVMDRSNVGDGNVLKEGAETLSYIYVKEVGSDEPITKTFDITDIGQYYNETPTFIEGISIKAGADEVSGEVTFGAVMDVDGSFASMDNAKLLMSAKDPNFDYAAAAAKIDKEIADAVKAVENNRVDAPMATSYYDMNGRKVVDASGVVIRVETWADGYQRISKIVRK